MLLSILCSPVKGPISQSTSVVLTAGLEEKLWTILFRCYVLRIAFKTMLELAVGLEQSDTRLLKSHPPKEAETPNLGVTKSFAYILTLTTGTITKSLVLKLVHKAKRRHQIPASRKA